MHHYRNYKHAMGTKYLCQFKWKTVKVNGLGEPDQQDVWNNDYINIGGYLSWDLKEEGKEKYIKKLLWEINFHTKGIINQVVGNIVTLLES